MPIRSAKNANLTAKRINQKCRTRQICSVGCRQKYLVWTPKKYLVWNPLPPLMKSFSWNYPNNWIGYSQKLSAGTSKNVHLNHRVKMFNHGTSQKRSIGTCQICFAGPPPPPEKTPAHLELVKMFSWNSSKKLKWNSRPKNVSEFDQHHKLAIIRYISCCFLLGGGGILELTFLGLLVGGVTYWDVCWPDLWSCISPLPGIGKRLSRKTL